MLKWALIFAIVAFVAGGLGLSGIASGAGAIANVLFFIFLAIAIVMFLVGSFVVKKVV